MIRTFSVIIFAVLLYGALILSSTVCQPNARQAEETFIAEDTFVAVGADTSDAFAIEGAFRLDQPSYEELQYAVASLEESVDSLNSYVSRLEYKIYILKYPKYAQLDSLTDVGWKGHIVVKGETLSGIAAKYLGSWAEWPQLYRLNRSQIKDPDLIYPGQVLRIQQIFGDLFPGMHYEKADEPLPYIGGFRSK